MKWYERKNGISVLIACRNEEAMIALCVRSFLEFGDELIVVDNGSTDRTTEIVRGLVSKYPGKIKLFNVPELTDLYHVRQFAFAHSSYRWVVRSDADFVAYTDGEYNILNFREILLRQNRLSSPIAYGFRLPNVFGDFRHTGLNQNPGSLGPNDPGRYVPPPVTFPTLRIYQVFPAFRFKRQGRWEGVRFQRVLNKVRFDLDHPLWMHCNIKSRLSYLFRSERTNWRELGDNRKYPTLETYVREIIQYKYGTSDIDEASQLYFKSQVQPFLQPYDPEKYYPYPRLVREQMELSAASSREISG